MSAKQREEYFMQNARYMPDAPNKPYFIRVGSRTLYSDDTMDLREQFEREIKRRNRRARETR